MNKYSGSIIIFVLVILMIALFLYLYIEDVSDYAKKQITQDSDILANIDASDQYSQLKDEDILNTDNIKQTRFRILKKQVPESFLEDATSTSTRLNNNSLFFISP